jgi:chromosome partitioning protein
VSPEALRVDRGLGWPALQGEVTGPLGWPGGDAHRPTDGDHTRVEGQVSRETGGEPNPVDGVDTAAAVPDAVDAATAEDALASLVSRETERDEFAGSLPDGDDDTPLARAVADDARKRIALTGRVFPKPAETRVLTIANQKGGVGKTTTTVNVAAGLAQAGLTVLVIDIDPQGNASTALGVEHHSEVTSIYDVLVDGVAIADVVQECPDIPGLWCAPATIDLAGAEIELVSLVARETRLKKAIDAYLDTVGDQGGAVPDYVLIDCPPSLGLLTINAFVAAREVFIPIQCEYYALEGLSQLLKNIELVRSHLNPSLHLSTILLTMYDGRTRLSAQVAEEVRAHFPDQVLRTSVPRSVRISEAPSHGQTVMTYDPNSSGALSYLGAASELADRGAAPAPAQN